MELLLKLLQDAETEESLRIVAQQVERNQIMIETSRTMIWILLAFVVFYAIILAWSLYRLEKKI